MTHTERLQAGWITLAEASRRAGYTYAVGARILPKALYYENDGRFIWFIAEEVAAWVEQRDEQKRQAEEAAAELRRRFGPPQESWEAELRRHRRERRALRGR